MDAGSKSQTNHDAAEVEDYFGDALLVLGEDSRPSDDTGIISYGPLTLSIAPKVCLCSLDRTRHSGIDF